MSTQAETLSGRGFTEFVEGACRAFYQCFRLRLSCAGSCMHTAHHVSFRVGTACVPPGPWDSQSLLVFTCLSLSLYLSIYIYIFLSLYVIHTGCKLHLSRAA